MMNEVSIFFFQSMQLACLLSGLFMMAVSTEEIVSEGRHLAISRPRWHFAAMAGGLGLASVLAFAPRILGSMVFWLRPPPTEIGPIAVSSLLLLYCVSGALFCVISGRPRRSFTVFLLLLASSMMSTYLEFL